MSDVDKAREALATAICDFDAPGPNLADAIMEAARFVARDEFAKRSPAPVGEDGFDEVSIEIMPERPRRKLGVVAPTPPAGGSDGGEAWTEPPFTCPHITRAVASGELSEAVVIELKAIRDINSQLRHGTWAKDDRIADLEQRLAEADASTEVIRERLQAIGEAYGCEPGANRLDWVEDIAARANRAERDLAEARKRIGELERLVKQSFAWTSAAREGIKTDPDPDFSLANLRQYEADARALLPTEDGTQDGPEGQR
jgi:hypothetical protein